MAAGERQTVRRMAEGSSKTLWNVGWRYLLRHPWQTALMVIGIALGVAVVVGIDLANESASRAFDLSVDSVAGRATHQITGGPDGLSEQVYVDLRRAGVERADGSVAIAPVIAEYVSAPQMGGQTMQLLGIDPFADAPFRDYVAGGQSVPVADMAAFLTQPGAVLISTGTAARFGLKQGDPLALEVGGQTRSAFVAGLLEPSDSLSARTLDGLLLVDISTAQELTGRLGRLDRIDVILPEGDSTAQIAALLPPGARIDPVAARTGSIQQMTAAFRTNLTALSLLALVVGMFLIYNTMTFNVVQRRSLFGTLRCLGVTRREVFGMVVSEALIVGVVGAALGLGLGVLLGQGALRLVTRTINDLFFVMTARSAQVPLVSLVKGAALGIVATALTAMPPALEAASVPPRAALNRSGIEDRAQRLVAPVALAGVGALGVGGGALLIPSTWLPLSFGGTLLVIVGCAMLVPAAMRALLRVAAPVTRRLWGPLGRMAPRAVGNALSRTSIAVAALMVAVSVTIGISVMVGSFRHTVEVWLANTLKGDIYISVPGGTQTRPSTAINPAVMDRLRTWPGVRRIDTARSVDIDSPDGPLHVIAVNNPDSGEARQYIAADADPHIVWQMVQAGAVMVSEPFARRHNIPRHGGTVTLLTPDGPQTFNVVAIYADYGSVEGLVMMDQAVYQRIWHDDAITAVALLLEPGTSVDAVTRDVQQALAPIQQVLVRPNQALRDDVLTVFDQTFAITGALNVLATLVAFVGVLSALLSLQLEKQRELGILRAVGMTVRQVWGMTMLETGLMGAIAGLLSMPTGIVLALILVYIINRRSFGWTLQMLITPGPFAAAMAVAVGAALLAGLYPAYRLGRLATADAVRFE